MLLPSSGELKIISPEYCKSIKPLWRSKASVLSVLILLHSRVEQYFRARTNFWFNRSVYCLYECICWAFNGMFVLQVNSTTHMHHPSVCDICSTLFKRIKEIT